MNGRGLGGVAATADYVIVSDRELKDANDLFRCLKASSGEEVWAVRYPAPGNFDYGNSPRATPLVAGDCVYLFGATGHLTCASLATGKVVWEQNIRDEFDADDEPKWGACSSPLLADGKLIVNPGSKTASLAALDPKTGKVIWKTPGGAAGYGSFIAVKLRSGVQIVGHDADSLGGWDAATGKRRWRLKPENPHDFNVPTPIWTGDRLLVCTENNRSRLFQFTAQGELAPEPAAVNRSLAPDTHTPVVVGERVFGVWRRLFCLSLTDGLKPVWDRADPAFQQYCSVIASPTALLVTTLQGELLLIDATADQYRELGRLRVWQDERGCYAHPALVGQRLFLRGSSSIVCLDLG